jgi:RimJ/RimL family protein N-acetyltransferase
MLNGVRIHLRLFEKEDLPSRVKWINDEEINETLGFDWPASISKTQIWFQNTLNDNSKINFAIIDNESCKLIGMTGLLGIDYKNKNAEFYITIGEKEFLGLHIPDEVISLILEYAFLELGLKRVYLHTFDYNVKAQHVYERNGFVKEGVLRKHKWKCGELRDIVYYGIIKDEWEKRRKTNERR